MEKVPAIARNRSYILLKTRLRCRWHQRVRVRPHPELVALYLYAQYCKIHGYQYGESTCHCEESQLHLANETTALPVARTSPSGNSRTVSI